MRSVKATFYLPADLRVRLKALSARRGKTVSQLVTEGAELVIAREEGLADRDELARRAAAARDRLRRGLYAGPPIDADALLYASEARRAYKR